VGGGKKRGDQTGGSRVTAAAACGSVSGNNIVIRQRALLPRTQMARGTGNEHRSSTCFPPEWKIASPGSRIARPHAPTWSTVRLRMMRSRHRHLATSPTSVVTSTRIHLPPASLAWRSPSKPPSRSARI